MKRSLILSVPEQDQKMKKNKIEEVGKEKIGSETEFSSFNEDILFEILKRVDAPTLGKASCVSKNWQRTSSDERLWEMLCIRHWVDIGCPHEQVRNVVMAFGGFRLLHSLFLRPVLKATAKSQYQSSSIPNKWGRDEVHLSLALLSTRYYGMMDCSRFRTN